MAITNQDGVITVTGEHINVFRLMTMRSALKLEKMGLKNSRGSVRALVKREFVDCPKTNDFDKLINFLTEKIGD